MHSFNMPEKWYATTYAHNLLTSINLGAIVEAIDVRASFNIFYVFIQLYAISKNKSKQLCSTGLLLEYGSNLRKRTQNHCRGSVALACFWSTVATY